MRIKNNNDILVDHFFTLKGWANKPREFYIERKINYGRFCKEAKGLLELCDNNLEVAKNKISRIKLWADDNKLDWIISTATKRFLEIK